MYRWYGAPPRPPPRAGRETSSTTTSRVCCPAAVSQGDITVTASQLSRHRTPNPVLFCSISERPCARSLYPHTSPDKATGGADDGAVGASRGLPPCGLLLVLLRAAGGGGAARARARTLAAATAAESALNFVGIAMSVDAASTGGSTGTDGRAERPAAAAGTAALAGGALAHTRSKAGRTALAPTKSSRLPRSTQ